MAIFAPRWANFIAIAAPMPRLAPVTEEGIRLKSLLGLWLRRVEVGNSYRGRLCR